MIKYGPVEPLSDPKRAAALAELLNAAGLVPHEVEVPIYASKIEVEVTPDNAGFFLLRGITSKNTRADRLRIDLQVNGDSVLVGADPASFNLGHLVPMDLGAPFSRRHPLMLVVSSDHGSPPQGTLQVTLWGETHDGSHSAHDFRPHRIGKHLKPHPETVWPAPDALEDVEWVLRYGTETQRTEAVERERLMIASVIASYRTLLVNASSARQLPGLRQAIRNGDATLSPTAGPPDPNVDVAQHENADDE